MTRRATLRAILFMVAAVIFGFFYHQGSTQFGDTLNTTDKSDFSEVVPVPGTRTLDNDVAVRVQPQNSPFDTIDPSADTSNHIVEKSNPQIRNVDVGAIADRLLSSLKKINLSGSICNHEQWTAVRTDILELIDEHPELVTALIEQYPATSADIEKSFLKDIFQFADHDTLEHELIQRVMHDSPETKALWLDLIQTVGIVHADNQELLLSQLSSLDEPTQIRNAVNAFLPDSELSINSRHVMETLEPLYQHPNDSVKLAVVRKVGEWATPEHSYLLEQILQDSSISVQHVGVRSLGVSGLQSDPIRKTLLGIMQNVSTDWN
ncbi:MAG: HEAT repeat domain-containing protein [Granulosicoccus sp.]